MQCRLTDSQAVAGTRGLDSKVYRALACYAFDETERWPYHQYVADGVGVRRETVNRSIQRLRRASMARDKGQTHVTARWLAVQRLTNARGLPRQPADRGADHPTRRIDAFVRQPRLSIFERTRLLCYWPILVSGLRFGDDPRVSSCRGRRIRRSSDWMRPTATETRRSARVCRGCRHRHRRPPYANGSVGLRPSDHSLSARSGR